jgi:uncharacterized protein YbbK (DUF523 family)
MRGGKILISACLLGAPVRFDGGHKRIESDLLDRWRAEGRLVPICPEEAGGLGTPRPAAERNGDRVVTRDGADVTDAFMIGAEAALALANRHGCRFALLKENSPSCGSSLVHDGTFSARKIAGQGVTAALLRRNDIAVFSEHDIEALAAALGQ